MRIIYTITQGESTLRRTDSMRQVSAFLRAWLSVDSARWFEVVQSEVVQSEVDQPLQRRRVLIQQFILREKGD